MPSPPGTPGSASPVPGAKRAAFDPPPAEEEDIYANPPSLLSTLQDQLQSDINDPALRCVVLLPTNHSLPAWVACVLYEPLETVWCAQCAHGVHEPAAHCFLVGTVMCATAAASTPQHRHHYRRRASIGPGQLGLAAGAVLFGLVFVLVAGGDFATSNRYKGVRPSAPPPDPIEMTRLAAQVKGFEARLAEDPSDLKVCSGHTRAHTPTHAHTSWAFLLCCAS